MGSRSRAAETRFLSIGQHITMVVEQPGDQVQPEGDGYLGRVEDVQEDLILVSLPTRPLQLLRSGSGFGALVKFPRDGLEYMFRAKVEAYTEDQLPVLYLRRLSKPERIERRAYVRVDVLLEPSEVIVLGEDGRDDAPLLGCLVVNISAGGVGLVSRRPLPVGCRVRLVMQLLLGFGRVATDAQVVRSAPVGEQLRRWRLGLSFRGIGRREQDRLAGFVLSQQRLLRQRGLL